MWHLTKSLTLCSPIWGENDGWKRKEMENNIYICVVERKEGRKKESTYVL